MYNKNKEKDGGRRDMVEISNRHFNLQQICDSGQCFRMKRIKENTYRLIAGERTLKMEEREDRLLFFCKEREWEEIWKDYFDMDADYETIIRSIDRRDDYLRKAAEYGSGIRILHQDLWEMMISFIISQQNNIKRIQTCIETICGKFGEKKTDEDGEEYFAFPTPEALAGATEEELRRCNLGYRSRYIKKTAEQVQTYEKWKELKTLPYPQAKAELMKFCGIGQKVSDCICLFALQKKEAFPIDTHIRQVLQRRYPDGFPFEKYKKNAGVIQQYIFYYDLTKKEKNAIGQKR